MNRVWSLFRKGALHSFLGRTKWKLSSLFHKSQQYVKAEKWDGDKPLISIVVPCYNHGEYLSEAVDSVLSQTWQDFEILVVNDGSTEPNTLSILETFSRPKTRLIDHEVNRGLPAARNTGVRQAKGKYICCLDADDKLHPTFLEKAILILETNYGMDFVYSWTQVFGEESRVWYNPEFDPGELIHHNQIFTAAVYRRRAWEAVGGYREEMVDGYEDWEFWIRMAKAGFRGHRIPEKLLFVRRVGRSFIHRAMERHEQLVADIQRYNPEVYKDLSWTKEVKQSYKDVYTDQSLINIRDPEQYATLSQPVMKIIRNSPHRGTDFLSDFLDFIRKQSGACVLLAFRSLDEEEVDFFRAHTPFVYILPSILPKHLWKLYLHSILKDTRGIQLIKS